MDLDGSKEVEFEEFLQVIASERVEVPADSATREAFLAVGGNVSPAALPTRSGHVTYYPFALKVGVACRQRYSRRPGQNCKRLTYRLWPCYMLPFCSEYLAFNNMA